MKVINLEQAIDFSQKESSVMVIKVGVAHICPTHVHLTVVEARLPLL